MSLIWVHDWGFHPNLQQNFVIIFGDTCDMRETDLSLFGWTSENDSKHSWIWLDGESFLHSSSKVVNYSNTFGDTLISSSRVPACSWQMRRHEVLPQRGPNRTNTCFPCLKEMKSKQLATNRFSEDQISGTHQWSGAHGNGRTCVFAGLHFQLALKICWGQTWSTSLSPTSANSHSEVENKFTCGASDVPHLVVQAL